MTQVYLLQGWMGGIEWLEGVYADEAHAQTVADELWKDRASKHAPEWTRGRAALPTGEAKHHPIARMGR